MKQYIKPLLETVILLSQTVMNPASLSVNDNEGQRPNDLSPTRRGSWGNLWSDD